jgi:Pyruvate/2-oxoacid:ferredoxin oxidoreductase gamma subunit
MLNMVMVGAMLAKRPILPLCAIEEALIDHLPAGKSHLLDANLHVLRRGYEMNLPESIPM